MFSTWTVWYANLIPFSTALDDVEGPQDDLIGVGNRAGSIYWIHFREINVNSFKKLTNNCKVWKLPKPGNFPVIRGHFPAFSRFPGYLILDFFGCFLWKKSILHIQPHLIWTKRVCYPSSLAIWLFVHGINHLDQVGRAGPPGLLSGHGACGWSRDNPQNIAGYISDHMQYFKDR